MALLAAVRAAGVPRLIFSSTGSMYDPSGVVPLAGRRVQQAGEDAVIRPANPYAATKLAVDLMLAGECEAFGLGAASLRYFNASGAVGRPGRAAHPESHLIPIVLQVAGGQRERADDVRRRLPDAGRHLRPRLHPRRRPGHRAPAGARRDHARQARGLQPRQRRRLQRQAGHRGRPRGHRPPDPGQAGAAPSRRPGRHGRLERQGPPRARLAARPAPRCWTSWPTPGPSTSRSR